MQQIGQIGTDEERAEAITRKLLGWTVPVTLGGLGCWTDDCSEWEGENCQRSYRDSATGLPPCPIGLTINFDKD